MTYWDVIENQECRLLDAYDEWAARASLERARKVGKEKFAWHCPVYEHWHVTDKPLRALAEESAK